MAAGSQGWLLGVKVLAVGGGRETCGMGEGEEDPCGGEVDVGIEDTGMGSLLLIGTDVCREHMYFLALSAEEA